MQRCSLLKWYFDGGVSAARQTYFVAPEMTSHSGGRNRGPANSQSSCVEHLHSYVPWRCSGD